MSRRGLAAVALSVAAVVAAPLIGGRTEEPPAPSPADRSSATERAAGRLESERSPSGRDDRDSGVSKGAGASGEREAVRDETVTSKGFPLSVRLGASCVPQGGSGIARIETVPGAGLALLVAYSDEDAKGPYSLATADPATGRYAWTFAVAPDAPRGRATVLVAASNWQGNGGGTARRVFRVAALGGC